MTIYPLSKQVATMPKVGDTACLVCLGSFRRWSIGVPQIKIGGLNLRPLHVYRNPGTVTVANSTFFIVKFGGVEMPKVCSPLRLHQGETYKVDLFIIRDGEFFVPGFIV